MFFVCVTVGLVLLASKYRNNLIRSVQNICHNITNNNASSNSDNNNNYQLNEKNNLVTLDNIIVADSLEKCDYAVQRIYCNLSDGILGFDCEWVNEKPVSLLQLATDNGICALFRLGKIGYVPPKLQELLANDCILKVGVAPYEDGKKLTNDYGCNVVGTVDLRVLANKLNMPSRESLAALCLQYLGVEMEKILDVRCGNWNADILTAEQIEYAAYDAISSVLIYRQIRNGSSKSRSIWGHVAIYIKKKWGRTNCALIHNLPEGIIDTRYKASPSKRNNNCNIMRHQVVQKNLSNSHKNNVATRKEPLYHNCYLQAPDGETLCTCDRKKAEWYISKKLGIKVKDDPLTVRLSFEPSGRAFGEVGQYYIQVKVNQCVVCGVQDKFIKKNVVPREYRKYFPLVMKAHQSHDVLLLCPTCHEISNRNDLDLRKKLAVMCDAPLSGSSSSTTTDYHSYHRHKRQRFMSAVKALRNNSKLIPSHRKLELMSRVSEYAQFHQYPHSKIVEDEFINEPVTSSSHEQSKQPTHGFKVVQYFAQREGGLVVLERLWREHFLHTMQPQYLPELWSVHHNQQRLEIRQIQNRIEPEDAKIAGLI